MRMIVDCVVGLRSCFPMGVGVFALTKYLLKYSYATTDKGRNRV